MLYKADFTRYNGSVDPHIKHTIEVVFDFDEELTKENIKEFREEAFKALYSQHPESKTTAHPTLPNSWGEWIMSNVKEVVFRS